MVSLFFRQAYLQEAVFENNASDHETWSIRCHVEILVDFTVHLAFTYILHRPLKHSSSVKEANLDRLFHERECLKCSNDHGLSTSCVWRSGPSAHHTKLQPCPAGCLAPTASFITTIGWQITSGIWRHLRKLTPSSIVALEECRRYGKCSEIHKGKTGRSHTTCNQLDLEIFLTADYIGSQHQPGTRSE